MVLRRRKPTDSELEILQILWTKGSATVKEVNTQLSKTREVGYTTTLKLMQIMTDKKLVTRNTQAKRHVYRPAISEGEVQEGLLNKIISTAFKGSASGLVMQVLGNHKTTPEELAEIKQLIENMENEEQ